MSFAAGLLFNYAIICNFFEMASIQEKFKIFKHDTNCFS